MLDNEQFKIELDETVNMKTKVMGALVARMAEGLNPSPAKDETSTGVEKSPPVAKAEDVKTNSDASLLVPTTDDVREQKGKANTDKVKPPVTVDEIPF